MHDSPHIVPLEHIDFGEIDFKITVAEVQKQVPFAIERVYWLTTHTRGAERGNHAHINSGRLLTLEMSAHAVLLCLSSHRFVNRVTTYDFNEFTGA